MRICRAFLIVLSIAILGGCSTVSSGGYYWGDYSTSYYDLLKSPTSEQLAKRVDSLQQIVKQSGTLGLRVPPTIHAELGQALMKQGLKDQALTHFRKEITLYPESAVFLHRIVDDL
jgi:hypothetical protein